MKTLKARVRNGSVRLPKKLRVKDGTEVRILIPEAKGPALSSEQQRLFDEIMALRRKSRPTDVARLIREMRDGGREVRY